MTPEQVKQASQLILNRDALIAAREMVQRKKWRERDEPEQLGTLSWDGTHLSGVELSRAELDEWLRQKLEAVNQALADLGVVLHK